MKFKGEKEKKCLINVYLLNKKLICALLSQNKFKSQIKYNNFA